MKIMFNLTLQAIREYDNEKIDIYVPLLSESIININKAKKLALMAQNEHALIVLCKRFPDYSTIDLLSEAIKFSYYNMVLVVLGCSGVFHKRGLIACIKYKRNEILKLLLNSFEYDDYSLQKAKDLAHKRGDREELISIINQH